MAPRKTLTKTEYQLLKQKIIKEYKDKQPVKRKESPYSLFVKRLRRLIHYNIFIGVVLSVIFIYLYGFMIFLRTVLGGIIFATIGTAVAGILLKKE